MQTFTDKLTHTTHTKASTNTDTHEHTQHHRTHTASTNTDTHKPTDTLNTTEHTHTQQAGTHTHKPTDILNTTEHTHRQAYTQTMCTRTTHMYSNTHCPVAQALGANFQHQRTLNDHPFLRKCLNSLPTVLHKDLIVSYMYTTVSVNRSPALNDWDFSAGQAKLTKPNHAYHDYYTYTCWSMKHDLHIFVNKSWWIHLHLITAAQ